MSNSIVSVPAKRVSVLADSLSSVEALIETWILGRKSDTVRSYLKSLALFTDFINIAPGDLKEFLSHIDAPNGNMLFLRYAKQMQASKAASNTIATRLTAVRSFLSLCRTAGWINWTLEVKPGIEAVQYRDTRGPGHKGFAKIIDGITGLDRESRRDRAILWLLYSPALRRAEVSRIDLGDIDLEDARVMIWQKKKRDQVSVTLPPEAVSAILLWLEVRAQAGPCGENDPLFVSVARAHVGMRKRLSGGSIWKVVAKRSNAVGIKTSPHGIRHAAITHALHLTKGNIREVAQFSRHANVNTVQIYDDNRKDLQGSVARRVGRAVGRGRR